MIWLQFSLGLFLALMFISVVRARRRLDDLDVIPESESAVSPRHLFITAPGVTLNDATRRTASDYATKHGLGVLDLVPGSMPAQHAWNMAQLIDPWRLQRERLGSGHTAGYALLVDAEVVERADEQNPPGTTAEFVRIAQRLKRYVGCGFGMAIASGLKVTGSDPYRDRAVLTVVLGAASRVVVLGTPAIIAAMIAGLWLAPILGVVTVVLFQMQPALCVLGLRIRCPDVWRSALVRWLIELRDSWRMVRQPSPLVLREQRANELRPVYANLLQQGTEHFFSERAEACPVCRGSDLKVQLQVPDLLQHKPGTFTLERCQSCDHVFQNPRLSPEGLDFYYRDFYDGLGEDVMEAIFAWGTQPYLDRAAMVLEHGTPRRWLDVGCGHGHFSAVIQDMLPETEFDGLDLSESVEDAARRRWISQAFRGFFPELAPKLEDRYDAISMSHYLEHTPDPWAEIEAAHTALKTGGQLLIEVPNPESAFGRWLGRLWLPWFQPQHLHFLSVANLEHLLRERGFEVVEVERSAAHLRVDILFAAYLAMSRIAPPLHLPWRPPPSLFQRLKHTLVWGNLWWLLLVAHLIDQGIAPLIRRVGASNTYRLLARKKAVAYERAA